MKRVCFDRVLVYRENQKKEMMAYANMVVAQLTSERWSNLDLLQLPRAKFHTIPKGILEVNLLEGKGYATIDPDI